MYCKNCSNQLPDDARKCNHCGALVEQPRMDIDQVDNTDKISLLLCCFFGILGVHRYYEGDILWGVLYTCTLGLCGFGWIYDLIQRFIAYRS